MEFKELVSKRRSVRKFTTEPIAREDLLEIIGTAINAPSAGNEQMWYFTIVTNQAKKEQMADIIRNKIEMLGKRINKSQEELKPVIKAATFFVDAPAVIVVTTSVYRSKADKMLLAAGFSDLEIDVLRCRPDLQSIGAVIQTFLLAAWEKGYGTCWMTGPNVARPELESFLGIAAPRSLAALIAIGKPEIIPKTRGRKAIDEVVTFVE